MNSPILRKIAKRKTGWRPEMMVDSETNKPIRNKCMVHNGHTSKLIEVEGGTDEEIDLKLQATVIEAIAQLTQRDKDIMFREVIIFSAIASASINQAQYFTPLVAQEAKMRMKEFVGQTEKFVNIIQKEAVGFNGADMEALLDNLEDATHRTFQKFSDSIIAGKLPDFIDYISAFNTEVPAKKKAPAKKLKAVK